MNDPHVRFTAWLAAGADGEPPRDLALHASLCPECSGALAALDLLGHIDPGLAAMPVADGTSEEPGGLLRALRFAGASAGVMLLAVVVGIGASQLIAGARASGEVAAASQTPQQGVLGGAGSPSGSSTLPTPSPTIATDTPSPTPLPETPLALPTPHPTPVPTRTPRPTPTPKPTPTPLPSVSDAGSPSASPVASQSALPSASTSASDTPSPSASASALP